MTTAFRLSLAPVTPETASSQVLELYERSKQASKMVPNMYTYMAGAPGLLETYMNGYQRFRTESGFGPVEQEVVLLAISRENECTYCVSAHSFVADAFSGVPRAVTDAIRDDSAIPDDRLATLARFVRHLVASRGRPTEDEGRAFLAAGFSEAQILYLILAIAVKTISNYTNHVCDTPLDAPFKVRAWSAPGALAAASRD